jgi:hypothetical protein
MKWLGVTVTFLNFDASIMADDFGNTVTKCDHGVFEMILIFACIKLIT